MDPFQREKTIFVAALEEAYLKIASVENSEMHLVQHRILSGIRREINALNVQLGAPVRIERPTSEPIKKLFGKDISEFKHATTEKNKPSSGPTQVEQAELKIQVDELWPKFLNTEADQLLDSVSDIEVRGVAKHAGLPVTETNPKTITTEFITQIKEALQKKVAAATPEENNQEDNGQGNDDDDDNDNTDNQVELKTNKQLTIEELKKSVETLYPLFSDIANKDIRDTYSDIEIRGIAKRAGLPVTETNPKKIDNKFLDQIKEAIKKKADIDKIGK